MSRGKPLFGARHAGEYKQFERSEWLPGSPTCDLPRQRATFKSRPAATIRRGEARGGESLRRLAPAPDATPRTQCSSQMDVPTRSAYVMSVVTPGQHLVAASFTAVPRRLAAALAPTLSGVLLGLGWLSAPTSRVRRVEGCLRSFAARRISSRRGRRRFVMQERIGQNRRRVAMLLVIHLL